MRKTLSLLVIVLVLTMVFCVLPPSASAQDAIVLKAATYHPLKHRLTDDCFLLWGKEVEKRTKGKVKFKWHLAGSLVKFGQSYDAVKTGLVDMSVPALLWLNESRFPVTNAVQLPFLVDSPSHASQLLRLMYQKLPEMKKEYSDVVPFGFSTAGINDLHFKGAPIKTLEDFKGRKMIAGSGMTARVMKGLGATSMVIKVPDMYTSLQRGMAEGLSFPSAPMRSLKLTDFLSGHTILSYTTGPHNFIMRKKTWDRLPKDVQKVFTDLTVSLSCLNAKTLENESAWVNDELKKRGDNFYVLPQEERLKWRSKLKFIYDEFVANLDKRGMNGQAVLEKIMALAEEARQIPCQSDSWWGRAGRK